MFRKKLVGIVLAIFFGVVAWFVLSGIKAVHDIEMQTVDIRQFAFSPVAKSSDKIVMIWLDDATMRALPYRSPVPRDFLTKLNDKLSAAKPALIAYDIFFKGKTFKDADDALARSFLHSDVYAVMPLRSSNVCNEDKKNHQIDGCVDRPDEPFYSSLNGVGLADLPFSSSDSIVRRARFLFSTNQGMMPSFASILFKKFTGLKPLHVLNDKSLSPRFGPFETSPLLDDGTMLIRFAGPPEAIGDSNNVFKIYSANMIVDGLIPDSWLKDKIILVGAAYSDATDAYLTPYYRSSNEYRRMNGVEIHANILSSLLTRNFFYVFLPWERYVLVLFLIAMAGIISVLVSPQKSAVTFIILCLSLILESVHIFRANAIVMPIVIPMFSSMAAYIFGVGWSAVIEGRQKRFIKGMFSRYVPSVVVERMTKKPELLKLGGEEKKITSLFTDIASFTSISEKLNPTELVSFLNDYLGRMNDILFKYGATLDKYEGDAIIAFFNAPLDIDEHETAAAMAAIEIQKASDSISDKWYERCGRDIITRIGINSGLAVVGNIGSKMRFDYTAMGDTINLASRLEGVNKFYGTRILVSEASASQMNDLIIKRPIDIIRVKGKDEPVMIFEIFGEKNLGQYNAEMLENYDKAFELFQSRKPQDALHILDNLVKSYPSDGPSVELSKRCRRAIDDPEWDLITDLKSK